MMSTINANPEAVALAERMLANHDRELSFAEVIALVYNRFFNRKEVQ
jgi:hypothetical protein